MTPQARDGAGSPLPTYRELLQESEILAYEWNKYDYEKENRQIRLVNNIIRMKDMTRDFDMKLFCDDNGLTRSTWDSYVSDVSTFSLKDRMTIDPAYLITVTGWRYLNEAVRIGLPTWRALEIAKEQIDDMEYGATSELSVMKPSFALMKQKAMKEAQAYADGKPAVFVRKQYGQSPKKVRGVVAKRALGFFGYVDFAGINDNDILEIIGLTLARKERDE